MLKPELKTWSDVTKTLSAECKTWKQQKCKIKNKLC